MENKNFITKRYRKHQLTMFIDEDLNVWFKGPDLIEILDFVECNHLMEIVDHDDQVILPNGTLYINEFGLYSVLHTKSNQDYTRKKFKKWLKLMLGVIRQPQLVEEEFDETQFKLREMQLKEAQVLGLNDHPQLKELFINRLLNEINHY
jgi:prophage antirepressor-like protein